MSTTPTLDKMLGLLKPGNLTVDNMTTTLSPLELLTRNRMFVE
jgi:hypothetical protein